MEGFQIEIEVSLRDCRRFTDFLKDIRFNELYLLNVEQVASNYYILQSDVDMDKDEIQDFICELEQVFEGFEIEMTPEY